MWKIALLGMLLGCTLTTALANSEWKTFTSDKHHFSIHYPVSWRRIRSNENNLLYVVNFPQSAKVKVLAFPPGGAEIVVKEAKVQYKSIDEWINKANRFGAKVIGRQVIKLPNAKSNMCYKLVKVVTRTDIGLPAQLVETSYYCSTHGHLFVVGLGNWQWDSRQKKLQALALEIARSLRVQQQ